MNSNISPIIQSQIPSFLAGGDLSDFLISYYKWLESSSSITIGDISDLTVTLTPQSASSKFLITAVVNSGMDADGYDGLFRLLRGSTVIGSVNENQTNGWTGFGQIAGQQGFTGIQSMVITYLDTPNTTSPLTYHIEGINLNNGHNFLINYRGAGTFTTTSHMTITELRP